MMLPYTQWMIQLVMIVIVVDEKKKLIRGAAAEFWEGKEEVISSSKEHLMLIIITWIPPPCDSCQQSFKLNEIFVFCTYICMHARPNCCSSSFVFLPPLCLWQSDVIAGLLCAWLYPLISDRFFLPWHHGLTH